MLDFLILSLAVYRLSMFMVYDDGPFDVFQRLRESIGILYYDNGEPIEGEYKGWAKLLSCLWCVSVWLGFLLAICYALSPSSTVILCSPFSLSAAAMIIERIVNG